MCMDIITITMNIAAADMIIMNMANTVHVAASTNTDMTMNMVIITTIMQMRCSQAGEKKLRISS